jgi:hypothetical protein
MTKHLTTIFLALALASPTLCAGEVAGSKSESLTTGAATVEKTRPQGKVLSHLKVDRYLYAEVEYMGESMWVAGPFIEVYRGDIISWKNAYLMQEFTSKKLNRTFATIYFADAISLESSEGRIEEENQGNVASDSEVNQGKVVSLENVNNYTYLELETADGSNLWLAVPTSNAKAGDKVLWHGGAEMEDFESKSLGRTFSKIIFVNAISILD